MTFHPETEDVQSFERRSNTYEDSVMQILFFDRFHHIALDAVPAGIKAESILDIGCGTGRLLRKAAKRWPAARLTGVDPAEGMVEEARRLTPQAQFLVSPAESIPLSDASVDLVFSTLSFHHWQDQAQAVKQVARLLHPGGVFVLVDLLPPLGLDKIFQHGRQVHPSAVSGMFAQAGLEVEAQRRMVGHFLIVTVGRRVR
jgi:ubiquinone/menaquinone biosynthesis C-methylase UbiE